MKVTGEVLEREHRQGLNPWPVAYSHDLCQPITPSAHI